MRSEFGFLENLQRKYRLGRIGDDCAVLPKDRRTDLVVTTDLLVEDIDFRLAWTTPELIGRKALSVSLSDVAAMGAKPVWAMVSIGVPERLWKTEFIDLFYRGWMSVAKKFGVELVGGDVSKTPDKLVVDSIVAGEVGKGRAVLRSTAAPGDLIFVSGELGGAAAGLALLEQGFRPETATAWQKRLIDKQLSPYPQVNLGVELGAHQIPSAMIDLSDGLSSDLAHLCRLSRVGAKIHADRIPFHRKLNSLTKSVAAQIDFALNGGEDFELLYTAGAKKISRLEKRLGHKLGTPIGEITANPEIIELVTAQKVEILAPKGFRHF